MCSRITFISFFITFWVLIESKTYVSSIRRKFIVECPANEAITSLGFQTNENQKRARFIVRCGKLLSVEDETKGIKLVTGVVRKTEFFKFGMNTSKDGSNSCQDDEIMIGVELKYHKYQQHIRFKCRFIPNRLSPEETALRLCQSVSVNISNAIVFLQGNVIDNPLLERFPQAILVGIQFDGLLVTALICFYEVDGINYTKYYECLKASDGNNPTYELCSDGYSKPEKTLKPAGTTTSPVTDRPTTGIRTTRFSTIGVVNKNTCISGCRDENTLYLVTGSCDSDDSCATMCLNEFVGTSYGQKYSKSYCRSVQCSDLEQKQDDTVRPTNLTNSEPTDATAELIASIESSVGEERVEGTHDAIKEMDIRERWYKILTAMFGLINGSINELTVRSEVNETVETEDFTKRRENMMTSDSVKKECYCEYKNKGSKCQVPANYRI